MKNKCFLLIHLGLGDLIHMIGAIRYLSTKYEKVKVTIKKTNMKNFLYFFSDNENIIPYPIMYDSELSPNYGANIETYNKITNGYDVYKCGFHIRDITKPLDMDDFPVFFYKDLNIPLSTRVEHFKIARIDESEHTLYNKLKKLNIEKYIFIHMDSSNAQFTLPENLKKILDDNKVLLISPTNNYYEKNNSNYEKSKQFLNYPLIYYCKLIENCNELHLVDSSFFGLSCYLDLSKVEKKFCYFNQEKRGQGEEFYLKKEVLNDMVVRKIL